MNVVNARQLELMRHTAQSGNMFGTEDDHPDECDFDKLVEQGLAKKMRAPDWMIDDVLFRLTEKGNQYLRDISTPI